MISIVLTHFNKGILLNRTIDSLQISDDIVHEVIIVDDASTDPMWISNIEQLKKHSDKIKIILNNENKGPAIRLNQGAFAATGKYIFFIDADDVLAPNRLQQFLSEMQAQDADLCYGKKIKVHDLKEAQQRQTPIWEASTQSLKYMIDHNLMQMCVMCTRELFIRSTGCNENIFIQDESLALNLGLQSQKIISTTLPSAFVILDPEETKINRGENRLSRHLEQQHYDMFYTLYDFISLNPKLGHQVHHLLLKKLLSTYWKSKKEQQQAHLFDCYIYLLSKVSPTYAWKRYHAVLTYYFNNLDHVRKCVERVSA